MTPVPPLGPLEQLPTATRAAGPRDLGLVMGGGGAQAAYQVGLLRFIARSFPELRVPYVTGASAGAINAALLASHHGNFLQSVRELSQLWSNLTVADVFNVDVRSLTLNGFRWLRQLASGGMGGAPRVRGLVDTQPLRHYLTEVLHAVDGELTGVRYNLERGRLKAVAISTSCYSTGRSVTWVQGSDIRGWQRPRRRSLAAVMTVEHVMASAALPLIFPAVQLENAWYGDGSIRLTAPLSPVLHLGARRILAISTRYEGTEGKAEEPTIYGYPPPAQVAGTLMNSIFLDLLDHDALRLERINRLLESLPPEKRDGLKPIRLLTLRPSQDLGRLAYEYEPQLPKAFRFLTRGLGTKQTRSPDFLSLILFQPDYLQKLMEVGEADAEARGAEILEFLREDS